MFVISTAADLGGMTFNRETAGEALAKASDIEMTGLRVRIATPEGHSLSISQFERFVESVSFASAPSNGKSALLYR